ILAQTIGQGLHAPLLGLGDLAPHLLDDGFELGGQFFDLLRTGVLARQEDVFVEGHADAFPLVSCSSPARSPSSPFGKRSKAQKAGARDAGPRGPAARLAAQSSVQLPAGDRAEARVIQAPDEKARCAATDVSGGKARYGEALLGLTGPMSRCLRADRIEG